MATNKYYFNSFTIKKNCYLLVELFKNSLNYYL